MARRRFHLPVDPRTEESPFGIAEKSVDDTRTVEVPPSAAALIEGMRDFGYTLATALADIIDNSVTAGAQEIEILSEMFDGQPRIAILDDGSGMSQGELIAAMKPGSKNPRDYRDENDLGRFGLGLKSASFSQCRRVTVVTSSEGKRSSARWDLDRVAESDRWDLEVPDLREPIAFSERLGDNGTLVLWEKLDRVVGDEDQAGRLAGNEALAGALDHLGLVFHRFLRGESNLQRVDIRANGTSLEARDPFLTSHAATIKSPPEKIVYRGEEIRFQAFTLPHHSRLSAEEWKKSGGPEGHLKNQGFYVYRAGRLIIHGTWFGLARQQELTKLSRVKVDLPNSLDHDWKIDIKKSTAQPPRVVRERLKRLIEKIAGSSKRVYTFRGARRAQIDPYPTWARVQKDQSIRFEINREHPIIVEAMERPTADSVNRILKLLEAGLPMEILLADLSGSPEQVDAVDLGEEELADMAGIFIAKLRDAGSDQGEIEAVLEVTEPFRSSPELAHERLVEAFSTKEG